MEVGSPVGNSGQIQGRISIALRKRIAALPGVEERPLHLRHGIVTKAYWVAGTEFVHFHGMRQLDVRVPDERLREELLEDPRAKINPFARSRIEFDVETAQDVEDAFRLVQRVHELLSHSSFAIQERPEEIPDRRTVGTA